MSQDWAQLLTYQTVDWTGLQSACSYGIFAWAGTTFPTSGTNQNLYKSLATITNYAQVTLNPSRANTDCLIVSDFTPSTSNSFTMYGPNITGGCISPETKIKISENEHRIADELKIHDSIYTKHEDTKEYGLFKILYKKYSNQERIRITLENTELICSISHILLINREFKKSNQLKIGDFLEYSGIDSVVINIEKIGIGPVIDFSIDSAHTYISNGILSHNKSLPIVWGYTTSSGACSGGTAGYSAIYTYSGTLGVGTRIAISNSSSYGMDPTLPAPYYYYSGGYIDIGFDSNGYYIAALGTCTITPYITGTTSWGGSAYTASGSSYIYGSPSANVTVAYNANGAGTNTLTLTIYGATYPSSYFVKTVTNGTGTPFVLTLPSSGNVLVNWTWSSTSSACGGSFSVS